MSNYEQYAFDELERWKQRMTKSPSLLSKLSGNIQNRINRIIPEKIHHAITVAIKQMTRTVILGAGLTTRKTEAYTTLQDCENIVRGRIQVYRNTAAAEGAITGAGGILLGLADFPLWLTIKIKLLFEIASIYGYNTDDYKERIYILHIFHITFSNPHKRKTIYNILSNWNDEQQSLPKDINTFDWRSFQQEYRDYIDLAKLLQLVPGIGAVVGAYVNHRLTEKLGTTAMNAYRMRWKNDFKILAQ